jgi:hypothetical protein
MKLSDLFFFSHLIQKALNAFRFSWKIFLDAIRLAFQRERRLKISSVRVNDKYLLSNGFIIVSWDFSNCLWVTVDGKIRTTNVKGLLLPLSPKKSALHLTFHGLFEKIKVTTLIANDATIITDLFSNISVRTEKLVSSFDINHVALTTPFELLPKSKDLKVELSGVEVFQTNLNIQIPFFTKTTVE